MKFVYENIFVVLLNWDSASLKGNLSLLEFLHSARTLSKSSSFQHSLVKDEWIREKNHHNLCNVITKSLYPK